VNISQNTLSPGDKIFLGKSHREEVGVIFSKKNLIGEEVNNPRRVLLPCN